jgi:3-deoxy-manno-octulosonate cytidylyltransferase (CMP-KDO synthetase)
MLGLLVPRAIAIIPARYSSTRFPGKPLATLRDRTLVEWVWSGARSAKLVEGVLIATDDERIRDAVLVFGGEPVMTPTDCASGTDRVAAVAASLEAEIIVNVQADEPLVTGSSLDRLVAAFEDPAVEAATLRERFEAVGDLFDPNQVKVAVSASGDALYFSRSAIPYFRGAKGHLSFDFRAALFERPGPVDGYWKHVGIYAYRKDVLLQFARTAPTPLERAESLEQLRLLETGHRIRVLDSDFRSVGVDTPQEMRRAAQVLDEREAQRGAMR